MAPRVRVLDEVGRNVRRSVVLLEDNDDSEINASAAYDALNEKTRGDVNSRLEHWTDGFLHNDYHHGWRDPDKSFCYVFRWKHKRQSQRFYGFLCHAKAPEDSRFVACVLVCLVQKNTQETDPAVIAILARLAKRADVIAAVRKALVAADGKETKNAQATVIKGEFPQKKLDSQK